MKILEYKIVSSTNFLAKKLAKENKQKPWTIILAQEQKAGYGKDKIFWFSPKGGLYFSIILPKLKIGDLQTLTILVAYIVAKVLKENFSLEPLIKLPNDVLIGERKIAGILVENVIGSGIKYSVMGIGLNTNITQFPKELKDIATSLKIVLKKQVNNKKIFKEIVKEIEYAFQK